VTFLEIAGGQAIYDVSVSLDAGLTGPKTTTLLNNIDAIPDANVELKSGDVKIA
jgi:hypothetical protein